MRSRKRIILADGSRLVREMLQRVIDKAEQLQVVDVVPGYEGLHSSIKRFDPEWVIVSLPYGNRVRTWIDACMTDHPGVRFVLLSPNQNNIKMKWQISYEEEYPDLTLQEFIRILQTDLPHT